MTEARKLVKVTASWDGGKGWSLNYQGGVKTFHGSEAGFAKYLRDLHVADNYKSPASRRSMKYNDIVKDIKNNKIRTLWVWQHNLKKAPAFKSEDTHMEPYTDRELANHGELVPYYISSTEMDGYVKAVLLGTQFYRDDTVVPRALERDNDVEVWRRTTDDGVDLRVERKVGNDEDHFAMYALDQYSGTPINETHEILQELANLLSPPPEDEDVGEPEVSPEQFEHLGEGVSNVLTMLEYYNVPRPIVRDIVDSAKQDLDFNEVMLYDFLYSYVPIDEIDDVVGNVMAELRKGGIVESEKKSAQVKQGEKTTPTQKLESKAIIALEDSTHKVASTSRVLRFDELGPVGMRDQPLKLRGIASRKLHQLPVYEAIEVFSDEDFHTESDFISRMPLHFLMRHGGGTYYIQSSASTRMRAECVADVTPLFRHQS